MRKSRRTGSPEVVMTEGEFYAELEEFLIRLLRAECAMRSQSGGGQLDRALALAVLGERSERALLYFMYGLDRESYDDNDDANAAFQVGLVLADQLGDARAEIISMLSCWVSATRYLSDDVDHYVSNWHALVALASELKVPIPQRVDFVLKHDKPETVVAVP